LGRLLYEKKWPRVFYKKKREGQVLVANEKKLLWLGVFKLGSTLGTISIFLGQGEKKKKPENS